MVVVGPDPSNRPLTNYQNSHCQYQIRFTSKSRNLTKVKERRKQIKKLYKSTTDQEEYEFTKRQVNCLTRLKEMAEILKGCEITENCYENNDVISKSDITLTRVDDQFRNTNSVSMNTPNLDHQVFD